MCSKVILQNTQNCPYIKSESYVYLEITHDLSPTIDDDPENIKNESYYLVAQNMSKIILESIDKHLIIAQKKELEERDYVIGKIVGANLSI